MDPTLSVIHILMDSFELSMIYTSTSDWKLGQKQKITVLNYHCVDKGLHLSYRFPLFDFANKCVYYLRFTLDWEIGASEKTNGCYVCGVSKQNDEK